MLLYNQKKKRKEVTKMTRTMKELKEMKAIIKGYYKIVAENCSIKVVQIKEKMPTWEGDYAMDYWWVGGELRRYAENHGIEVVTVY